MAPKRTTLQAYHQYNQTDLLALLTKDFLAFSLEHTVDNETYQVIVNNSTRATVLADGIIGFNLHSSSAKAKSIVLSCGVHGNETAPIEICNKLVSNILSGDIQTAHRVLFIFGNLDSMAIAERFVEENLNRLFSREIKSTSIEGKRAKQIMHLVDDFFDNAKGERLHYDLHTAIRPSKNEKFAVYPFLHGRKHSKEQLAFLSACDVNTILLSQTSTATFSYYSSYHHHAHAFTVELGKVKPFGENDMLSFTAVNRMLENLVKDLVLVLPEYSQCPLEIYSVNQVIDKHQANFKLHFTDDIANFTQFKKGQIFASETDKVYKAQFDGEAIVFPNASVGIGQRALLTVIPHEL